MPRQKVVIAGGGFAGVRVAVDLVGDDRFEVTLIAQHSHFRYLPTLYRAAKGDRRPGASLRLADIFDGTGVRLIHATAARIDRGAGQLVSAEGWCFPYDRLVLALGSVIDYSTAPGLRGLSYPVKTNDEIAEFKQHLHNRIVVHPAGIRIAIVGGGSIGVEMAGALPGYVQRIAANHGLDHVPSHITIVEPAPRLMRSRPAGLACAVTKRLERLGITLCLGRPIEGTTAETLRVGDVPLAGHTVVWAAGVVNPTFFPANGFGLTGRGKTAVNGYLEAEPGIYVIGDNADTHLSGLAQTALHHGAYVAADLRRQASGAPRLPYRPLRPRLPTTLIPVGPGWVAVQWGRFTISGRLGALLRYLADRVTFQDVESWPKAGERWLEVDDDARGCAVCVAAGRA